LGGKTEEFRGHNTYLPVGWREVRTPTWSWHKI